MTPNKDDAGLTASVQKALAVIAFNPDKAATLDAVRDLIDELKTREEELESEIKEAEEEDERKEHEQEIDDAREEGREEVHQEVLDQLAQFGGHQDCLEGAVWGQKLHPQCTCGWNDVATELERR